MYDECRSVTRPADTAVYAVALHRSQLHTFPSLRLTRRGAVGFYSRGDHRYWPRIRDLALRESSMRGARHQVNASGGWRGDAACGEEVAAARGNRAWQITRPDRWSATTVFDAETLEVISMFTSDSNNWAACAAYAG